jgi:hypothetical protein
MFGRKREKRFAYQFLREHFEGRGSDQLVTHARTFTMRFRPDLQIALDQIFTTQRQPTKTLGLHRKFDYQTLTFPDLWLEDQHEAVPVGPLQHVDVDIGEDRPVKCLRQALWLLHDQGQRYAVMYGEADRYGEVSGIRLEIAVPPGESGLELAEHYYKSLEQAVSQARSYRGKVLSLESLEHVRGQAGEIQVHRLPTVTRDQVILPARTIELMERNIFGFFAQRDRLAELKLSTKKGLLFHGPPGTGKTHSILYVASRLKDHTTLLITAEQIGLLKDYMALARLLQPSIVVLEDADLIARSRESLAFPVQEVLLNRLLNEMDGLRENAEILFILTTNHPESLEAALTSRPGRIDQAIEFPLPDDEGRGKLVALYGRDLEVSEAVAEAIVKRSDGVSPAFIKELMRRSAQFCLDSGTAPTLALADVESALDELLGDGTGLTAVLLGRAPPRS